MNWVKQELIHIAGDLVLLGGLKLFVQYSWNESWILNSLGWVLVCWGIEIFIRREIKTAMFATAAAIKAEKEK
jgi:hypothetical protein